MKRILILFVLLIIILFGIKISKDYQEKGTLPFFTKKEVIIKDKTFSVTLAKTQEEKQIGLSKHTSLPETEGMVFSFEKPDYYLFWMRDMKIPIDIIYIKNNKIVSIFENMQPPQPGNKNPEVIKPEEPSDTVLEIQAGLSSKYSFKKGDEVKLKI